MINFFKKDNSFSFKKNDFFKSFILFFSLNLRSEKNWVLMLAIPAILTTLTMFAFDKYSITYIMLPPQILAIFLISPLFVGIYFSINLIELRETLLIRRLKFLNIKPYQIVLTHIILVIFYSFISLAINITVNIIFSKIIKSSMTDYISDLFVWNWIYLILITVFVGTLSFLLSNFISNFFKGKNLAISSCVFIFIFLLLFSDMVLPSFITANNSFLTYFSYINILKYLIWISLMINSFAFIDFNGGIYQIVQSHKNYYVFIDNLYSPFIIVFIAIIGLGILTIWKFKWKEN